MGIVFIFNKLNFLSHFVELYNLQQTTNKQLYYLLSLNPMRSVDSLLVQPFYHFVQDIETLYFTVSTTRKEPKSTNFNCLQNDERNCFSEDLSLPPTPLP